MALKNIIITGSIGTYPTLSYGQKMYVSSTDEESFPIEKVIGSNGGSLPNLLGQTSSVDLYVNIDQKWSGYNDTQAGLVAYTQSFQNEFINGEFSGSVLTVSNGELTDPNCRNFLEVNTTEVNYSPFLYYSLYSKYVSTPGLKDGDFLNANTAPNNGEIFILNSAVAITKPDPFGFYFTKNTINYIKINRFDKQGNDNTLSLQELTNLRIEFSDIGVIEFPLFTISEYPTYYLYTTYYLNFPADLPFSSVDNNILNYSVSASSTFSFPVLAGSFPGDANITLTNNYNNIVYNSLGYFDGLAGSYNPMDTPNIPISFSFSCTVTGTTPFYADAYLIKGNDVTVPSNGIDGTQQGPFLTSPSILTFTGSFTPIAGEQYKMYLGGLSSVNNYTATNVNISFTQSVAPHTSSNLTVLEPYLTQNFYYNDCNALYGNATELEYDSKFYQVNYEGTTIPTNQKQILNNTAEIAPVKSYNYTAAAQILPRYIGSRNSTDNFNVSSTSSVISEEIITHTNLGPTKLNYPSVSSLGTYFAYFDFIGGTSYELINKKGAHILFLIDKDGNIQTPDINPPYYSNLLQNFEQNKNVNIVFSTSNGNVTNIQGIHPIIRTGLAPKPVIWSQSGSTANSSSTILFDNVDGLTVPDYRTTINFGSYSTTGDNWDIVTHALPHSESYGTNNTTSSLSTSTNSWIGISTSTNSTQGVFHLHFSAKVPVYSPDPPIPAPVTIKIDVSTDSGATWSPIATSNIVISQTRSSFALSSPPQTLVSGNIYRAGAISNDEYHLYGGTFSLSQTTPTSTVIVSPPYWTTGSSPSNILTGSAFIGAYSPINPLTQTAPTSSGYSSNLPFTLQPQDQIRFEGNEITEVYTILKVEGTNISGSLYLTLDRNIVSGTNLDSFFVRRYIPDPNFIIIDVPAEGGGNGYLFPEYTSLDIQNNLNSIIQNLKAKGVIPSS
jgi:hypothetical protein